MIGLRREIDSDIDLSGQAEAKCKEVAAAIRSMTGGDVILLPRRLFLLLDALRLGVAWSDLHGDGSLWIDNPSQSVDSPSSLLLCLIIIILLGGPWQQSSACWEERVLCAPAVVSRD